ncbi:MAG: hypothetical protein U1F98_16670 [Verrucomicrobiota bacterium]
MKHAYCRRPAVWLVAAAVLAVPFSGLGAADGAVPDARLELLEQQNRDLQEQLRRQQEMISSLSNAVAEIRKSEVSVAPGPAAPGPSQAGEMASSGLHFGKLRFSGEGAVAFFDSQSEGAYPNGTFRADEFRLFVDAQVLEDVYVFAELDLTTREESGFSAQAGEIYLDAENLSKLWGQDGQLNLRVGQFYIPFGEEYQERYAIDDPLITHSISDLWGVDEGVELYGAVGRMSYVVAVQNGGVPVTQDLTQDKSVSGRIGYDPAKWLHLSVSGMRTGDLSAQGDVLSAMWFGNGWFRSLGSSNATTFHCDLVEGDVQFKFPHTAIKAFGGWIYYDDNDPAADNHRNVYYYCVEGVQDLIGPFYAATRFSQSFGKGGFPIVGNAPRSEYLFGPLTDNLWCWSFGLGYRWDHHLVVKVEYAVEQGSEAGGERRTQENLFATQAAFAF